MSSTFKGALIGFALLVMGVSVAGVLGAETVMIAARETVDGAASQPPLAAVEGVSSGLFEAGHVVFDAGQVGASAKASDLAEVAREGRAGWLLQITVAYTQTKLDQEAVRVACSATFSLVNASTGATSFTDKVSASNAGREKKVDRAALGAELGKLISQKVVKALPSPLL
jgi:hypothetical protein